MKTTLFCSNNFYVLYNEIVSLHAQDMPYGEGWRVNIRLKGGSIETITYTKKEDRDATFLKLVDGLKSHIGITQ